MEMNYRGHTCAWFKEEGCLFFTFDKKSDNYESYDVRALQGLKKRFKEEVDKIEGPKVRASKSSLPKVYYIKKYHRGHYTIVKGTIKQLTDYFGYTLDCGHSWNQKINKEPKTYSSLISNLNKSYHETMGSCFDPDFVDEASEEDFTNAEVKGYRTSESN
jgi:hypothetical protein